MRDTRRTRFVGRPMLRREDQRLLTGQGQFIADIVLPRMLHAVFVRSQVAHARVRVVDVSRAAAAPGVALAMNGADLARLLPPAPDAQLSLPSKWRALVEHTLHNPQQPLLATDKVRHVGEAVAVVVAESLYAAEDAAELIEPQLEPLPAVVDPEQALRAGATLVHERFGTNLIGEFSIGKGSIDAALARAPKRLKRRFYHHRYSGIPMECRGVIGVHDPRSDTVTVWCSTQVVHWVRREAATILGLPESRVRCVAPDVGGGFGVKGHVYPEDLLIPYLARKIGRPVRWIENRHEHFLSATQSRDQIHEVEIGFDETGRILALRDDYLADCGAYNLIGAGVIYNTAAHLLGPYKVEHFATTAKIATTNKVPSAAYRGAGRPEASFAVERSMDLVAAAVGLEPADIRLRNMVRADEMPYSVGIPYRDGAPIIYDSGDFPAALRQAVEALGGIEAFRKRQREARSLGRYLGLGLGCYTEGTGVGPFESAMVRIDASGKVFLSGGSCPQGQGMETIFAQVVADEWSVTPDDVIVSLADTAAIPMGYGTVASRSTVTLSAAIHYASERLRKKVLSIAAHLLECAPADLELREGGVGIVGVPARTLPLAKIAQAARPGWDHGRPEGVDPGLEETFHFEPQTVTWSNATHAAIVEVDIETGRVTIEKYVVAHDCGNVVNPLLLEGQITGGAAQGLGGILLEGFVYDAEGQLLTGSLMDYALPRADEMPDFQIIHLHSPSPLNPLGVKGVGEGGAIGPPSAIANAVADALSPFGAEFNETPLKPEQIVAIARHKTGGPR